MMSNASCRDDLADLEMISHVVVYGVPKRTGRPAMADGTAVKAGWHPGSSYATAQYSRLVTIQTVAQLGQDLPQIITALVRSPE